MNNAPQSNGSYRSKSANIKRPPNNNMNMVAQNMNANRSKSAQVNFNNNRNKNNNQNQMMRLQNDNNNNQNGGTGVVMLVSTVLEAKQLNVGNKEAYLPDHLFWEVFKMTKAQFYALRPWKQKQMKRDTGFW